MNVSYDRFIRTTDSCHVATVQKLFKRFYDQGDIYKSRYEGWYCEPCESFSQTRRRRTADAPTAADPSSAPARRRTSSA